MIANGAVSDTFSPFVLLPPTLRFALDFPEALGDLGQALALPSHRKQSNLGLCAYFMAGLGVLSYMK